MFHGDDSTPEVRRAALQALQVLQETAPAATLTSTGDGHIWCASALQMAAETMGFDNDSLGHQDDIDAMAAEIASGVMSSDALSDTEDAMAAEIASGVMSSDALSDTEDAPGTYDQLAAEVSMSHVLIAGRICTWCTCRQSPRKSERSCWCDTFHVHP